MGCYVTWCYIMNAIQPIRGQESLYTLYNRKHVKLKRMRQVWDQIMAWQHFDLIIRNFLVQRDVNVMPLDIARTFVIRCHSALYICASTRVVNSGGTTIKLIFFGGGGEAKRGKNNGWGGEQKSEKSAKGANLPFLPFYAIIFKSV